MDEAVKTLQTTTQSHEERIQQLIQKTDQTAFAIQGMEKVITRYENDLNQIGKIAHTAKTFGNIALALASGAGIAILIYLYHQFAPLLFSK